MQAGHRSSFPFVVLLAAVAAVSTTTAAASAVTVDARLVAPPGAESELKSAASLEVRALPAALHQPVPKGEILVEMDVEKLQKELEGQRKTLASAQAEKRRLAVQRGATSSSPASNSRVDMANAQAVADATVQVTDAGNPALAFHGKVLAASPAGDSVALRIQPLELPYLALEVAASARLSVTP